MSPLDVEGLRERFLDARRQVEQAAVRGGRSADSVEIVLAGKYVAAGDAGALIAAGVAVVGENRLQDLEAKRAVVGDDLVYDFIGHLQRRKVKALLPHVRLIHSVDSLELIDEIDRRADAPVTVLCQVNLAGESTKSGIVPTEIDRFVQAASERGNVVLGGLMTLPPATSTPDSSRPYFAALRELCERLAREWSGRHEFRDLSMGTSQDFVIAAEEGATRVRIGRSVINPSR